MTDWKTNIIPEKFFAKGIHIKQNRTTITVAILPMSTSMESEILELNFLTISMVIKVEQPWNRLAKELISAANILPITIILYPAGIKFCTIKKYAWSAKLKSCIDPLLLTK